MRECRMFWSRSNRIGRNESCTCGSGLKFKDCCYFLPEDERSHSAARLREKNMEVMSVAIYVFGLNKRGAWEKLRSSISEDQVREFYKEYARIWPISTDVFSYLPSESKRLRGLYTGDMKPEKILSNVVRYSLYTDEIIVVSPFHHPHSMNPEYSPILAPSQHKQDTLECIYLLMSLAPWIEAGIVHFIPNPIDFDPELRKKVWSSAEARVGGIKNLTLNAEEKEEIKNESRDINLRMLIRMSDQEATDWIRSRTPNVDDIKIKGFLKHIEEERRQHPTWLAQPLTRETELMVKRMGANLELGLLIGQATGSYLYTNRRRQWEEILKSKQVSTEAEIWTPLSHSFQQLDFSFLDKVDPKFVYRIQEEGRLSNLRAYLRRLWLSLNSHATESQVLEFSDELHEQHSKAAEEWKDIDRKLREDTFSKDGLLTALAGSGIGAILHAPLDWKAPVAGFCLPAVNAVLKSISSRKHFRATVPLSVFIDLDNKGKLYER